MRVLSISGGQDTGGQGIRLKEAFDQHAPGWSMRTVCQRSDTYIGYPIDLSWNLHRLHQLYEYADIVHVHNSFAVLEDLEPKPTVIHHHGSMFRNDPAPYLHEAKERGAISIAATLDLVLCGEGIEWLPAPFDVELIARHRQPANDGLIHIAHAPTNRAVKSTDLFIEVTDRLAEQYPIAVDVIEQASWYDCLRRKGAADIFFDQALIGYGNNSIEAWCMGIPVIAGAQPETLALMRDTFGRLPFAETTEATLYDVLEAMVRDASMRQHYAQLGLAHAQTYHDGAAVVDRLLPIYRRVVQRAKRYGLHNPRPLMPCPDCGKNMTRLVRDAGRTVEHQCFRHGSKGWGTPSVAAGP